MHVCACLLPHRYSVPYTCSGATTAASTYTEDAYTYTYTISTHTNALNDHIPADHWVIGTDEAIHTRLIYCIHNNLRLYTSNIYLYITYIERQPILQLSHKFSFSPPRPKKKKKNYFFLFHNYCSDILYTYAFARIYLCIYMYKPTTSNLSRRFYN